MTRAFIRSLMRWENAMVGATAYPNSVALICTVDQEEAAFELDAAKAWVSFLERTATNIETMIADAAPASEADHAKIRKWRNVLPNLRDARDYALEHVASFADASAKKAAS